MCFQVFKYCFLYFLLFGFYFVVYLLNRRLPDNYLSYAFRFSGFVLSYSVFYFLGVWLGSFTTFDSEIRFYIWVVFEFISGCHLGFILGKIYLTYDSNQ